MRKVAHISVFYLLIAVIFVFSVTLTEKYYLDEDKGQTVIRIEPDFDSTLESVTLSDGPEMILSDEVTVLLDEFLDKNVELNDIEKNADIQALAIQDKKILYVKLAQQFYAQHDYEKVIALLEMLDSKERMHLDVQFIYAFSLSKASMQEQALEQYKLLVAYNPRSQAATLNLALLLKKAKLYEQAIPFFDKAASISSGNKKAKSLAGLASCHYKLGKFDDAVKYYSKSLEFRPSAAAVWIWLARSIAAADGPYEQVLDAFDKGIALSPRDYKHYLQKAEYQVANYAYSGAVETLEKALPLSDSPEINELLAWAYLEQGSRSKARKHLEKTTKHIVSSKFKKRVEFMHLYLDKQYKQLISELDNRRRLSSSLQYLKGLAYRRSGYFNSAFKTFEKLSGNKKYRWRVKTQTVRMTRSRKLYDEAVMLFDALLQHNDKAAFLWFEAALTHESLGQGEEGLVKINRALNLRPDNKVYSLAKARLLHLAGQKAAAMELLDNLLEKKPKYLRALRLSADILSGDSNQNKLIDTYEKILDLKPDDYEIQYSLAQAYMKDGNNASARKILLTLLTEQSHNVKARYLLSRNYYREGLMSQSLNEVEKLLKLDAAHVGAAALRNNLLEKIQVAKNENK